MSRDEIEHIIETGEQMLSLADPLNATEVQEVVSAIERMIQRNRQKLDRLQDRDENADRRPLSTKADPAGAHKVYSGR